MVIKEPIAFIERCEYDFYMQFSARKRKLTGEIFMLGWALTFLIVALIAAALGFGGVAGTAISIAQLIFYVAIILFAISVVAGLVRGRGPRML